MTMNYYTAEKLSTILGILTYIIWTIVGIASDTTWMVYLSVTGPLLAGEFCVLYLLILQDCGSKR